MAHHVEVRKSWLVYVRPALRLGLLTGLFLAAIAWRPEITAFAQANLTNATAMLATLLIPGLIAVLGLGLLEAFWVMCLIRSEVLLVTPAGVTYRSGLLPWRKVGRFWRYDQIYDVMFGYRPQFWGWLFRCGDLVIVGREGSTREYRLRGIHQPSRVQALIAAQIGRGS